jgi:hypothetical protein
LQVGYQSLRTLELCTYTRSGFSNLIMAAGLPEERDDRAHSSTASSRSKTNCLLWASVRIHLVTASWWRSYLTTTLQSGQKLLLLLGAGHLRNTAAHSDTEKWEIITMCSEAFKASNESVEALLIKLHFPAS